MIARLPIGARRLAAALVLASATGCRSLPPIPPADLNAPGWTVQQGQAVWKPNQSRPELAGELMLATNINGDCLVEFTKTPFALACARQINDQWRIEFGAGRHAWQGRGAGPQLFSWFELPRALAGRELSRAWRFTQTNGTWRLVNRHNGERLEGAFPP